MGIRYLVTFDFDSINPNLNGSFVYSPPSLYDDASDDGSSQFSNDSEHPGASKSSPVVLSFEFSSEMPPRVNSPTKSNPIICYITFETFLGTKPRLDSYSVPEETPEENIRPIKYPVAAENDNSVASYESKDLTKDTIVEGDDEVLKSQDITHAPMREFVGPYIKFSQKQLISRTERARLIKAGFEPILDKDGHIITSIGPSYAEREQLKIKLDLEEKDKLRQNDISFTFMGVTFKDGIFELFL